MIPFSLKSFCERTDSDQWVTAEQLGEAIMFFRMQMGFEKVIVRTFFGTTAQVQTC